VLLAQIRQGLVMTRRQHIIQQVHQHVPELRPLHAAQAPALSALGEQFIDEDCHLALLLEQLQPYRLDFGRDALVKAWLIRLPTPELLTLTLDVGDQFPKALLRLARGLPRCENF
jgi:hypothetical protein